MDHLSFIVWLYAFLSNMLKEENPSNFQFFFTILQLTLNRRRDSCEKNILLNPNREWNSQSQEFCLGLLLLFFPYFVTMVTNPYMYFTFSFI